VTLKVFVVWIPEVGFFEDAGRDGCFAEIHICCGCITAVEFVEVYVLESIIS
jgi:hypothetical protein